MFAHAKTTLNLTLAAHIDTLLKFHVDLTTNGWVGIEATLNDWEQ